MTELEVAISVSCPAWIEALPEAEETCRRAAEMAFRQGERTFPGVGIAEVSVLLANDAFVRDLNRRYRGRDRPTNVLSFSHLEGEQDTYVPAVEAPVVLGDVVVAFETAAAEAKREGKSLADHLSHLVVHGMLHLLGYDHENDTDAERMEGLEIRVLSGLGVAAPYPDRAQ